MHTILAARTNFSIGESILTVERMIEEVGKTDAKAIAITDTMSVTAMIDFTQRAKKADLKPIIGCRLRLVDDSSKRKVKGEKWRQPEYFLTYYVLSEKGLMALFKLLSLANSATHFYFDAKLGFDDLFEALKDLSADDVAIASSDAQSVFHHAKAHEYLSKISDALSRSNVFCTITPIDTPYWDSLNVKAIEAAKALGLQTLVTRPVNYGEGEADAAEIMAAISTNTQVSSIWHRSPAHRDACPLSTTDFVKEAAKAVKRLIARGMASIDAQSFVKMGLRNTNVLVDMVRFEWKKQPISLPVMAPNEFAAVVEACKKGWPERFGDKVFGHRPSNADLAALYKPRLSYELSVLKTLNFSGYFLLVADVVQFAKNSGILVGPGRGSVWSAP